MLIQEEPIRTIESEDDLAETRLEAIGYVFHGTLLDPGGKRVRAGANLLHFARCPKIDRAAKRLTVPSRHGASVLVDAVRALDGARVRIDDIALRRPTLDDVFLKLTGHAAEGEEDGDDAPEAVTAGRTA